MVFPIDSDFNRNVNFYAKYQRARNGLSDDINTKEQHMNSLLPQQNKTITKYNKLQMICSYCGSVSTFSVPVNLTNCRCDNCQQSVDPIQREGNLIVDHSIMRQLISTCYKYPSFAKQVINLYHRDYHHAKNEEFGIDKSLLLIHAANAVAQSGHRSILPFLCLPLACSFYIGFWLPPLGALISLFFASRFLDKNDRYREQFLKIESYDPTYIPRENYNLVNRIIKFTEEVQPLNIYFFSQFNPFQQFGHNISTWSFIVDRRKSIKGELLDKPLDLNIETTLSAITKRVSQSTGPGTSMYRFHIDDIILVDAKSVTIEHDSFIGSEDKWYYP